MQSVPRLNEEAKIESEPCSKPAGKPHLHDFWSRLCSKTQHPGLRLLGLPRFHAAVQQSDTGARYEEVQNLHGSGCREESHRRRNIQVGGF